MRLAIKSCLLALALLSQNACSAIGPESIRADRSEYNIAIQHTNDQELLLNIVRARYRDTLYFTTVERIAATQSIVKGISAGGSAGFLTNTPIVGISPASLLLRHVTTEGASAAANVSITENPTVFYSPIEGEKFVRQMMTPMNPQTLLLLIHSGWSIGRVVRVAVQEMNGLRNAPFASGPTPAFEPEYHGFLEAALLMRKLQTEQNLDVYRSADGVELRIRQSAAMSEPAMRLKKILKLSPNIDRFNVSAGDNAKQDGHTVAISTRPLIAAINYLAQGVEPPPSDMETGRVLTTLQKDGTTAFDWQDLLGGVIRIQSAEAQPAGAAVAVYYRGAWFFIADNDLESKSTFLLLSQLIALHSVPASGAPNLSIAVGGGR